MNATNWLSTKLNLLRNSAPASVPPEEVIRSTRERLGATLRVHKEALSPPFIAPYAVAFAICG